MKFEAQGMQQLEQYLGPFLFNKLRQEQTDNNEINAYKYTQSITIFDELIKF